jgi:hypothetical protein
LFDLRRRRDYRRRFQILLGGKQEFDNAVEPSVFQRPKQLIDLVTRVPIAQLLLDLREA